MNCISYPDIQPPTCKFTPEKSLKTITKEAQLKSSPINRTDNLRQAVSENQKASRLSTILDKQINGKNSSKNKNPRTQQKGVSQTSKLHKPALTEPVVPDIEWQDPEFMVNDRMHKTPTTKEYLFKVFAGVFQGVGSLPGPPHHIRLKEKYTPVQHPHCSVPAGMQSAYKTETD